MILLDPDLPGPDLDPDPVPRVRRAPSRADSRLQKTIGINKLPSPSTLSRFLTQARGQVRLRGKVTILLTTDAAMRRLNRQFRGVSKATDVLSFPACGPGTEEIAGDLAISVPMACRQAAEQGHTLVIEIKILILHGLLHLAGYDHEADTGQMARRERLLRDRLGLPRGLIERAAAGKPEKQQRGGSRGRGARR